MRAVFSGLLIACFSFASAFLTGCGVKREAESDCGFVQNVYGERISWKTNAPIPLMIHSSFPANMLPGLQAAMKAWEISLGRPVFQIVQTQYQSSGPQQDGVNVIYWLNQWEAQKSTEQARTSVYWVGDQIKEADIRINNKNFRFYIGSQGKAGEVHFESLMIHELGHVFGLKHKDDGNSVMGPFLASQTARTNIASGDLNNLRCEYM
jgi:hypothetical protein